MLPMLAHISHLATWTIINEFKLVVINYDSKTPFENGAMTSRTNFKAGSNMMGVIVRPDVSTDRNDANAFIQTLDGMFGEVSPPPFLQ